jgi:malate synthase
MKRSKYYIRVMRPTFQRAILTVEATSDEEAMRSALEEAEHMGESKWDRLEAERQPPVIEVALSRDEVDEDAGADVLDFVTDVQHAYALLQANLETGEGAFIAPTWLRQQSALMVADVTGDWAEALAGISDESAEGFYSWLGGQRRPANVIDFFAERDKRRGKPPEGTE